MEKVRDIKFVSYNGDWPNLCSGDLTILLEGETITLDSPLISGGYANWDPEEVGYGPWRLCEWKVKQAIPDITKLELAMLLNTVNENVEYGCCGGCI